MNFTKLLNEFAAQLPDRIKLRSYQVIFMFALLNSTYKRILIELPTGVGKSLMLGIMARFINAMWGVKVVVVVPNEVLAAIQ
jgi:superfamily II DNA or RNA helicase